MGRNSLITPSPDWVHWLRCPDCRAGKLTAEETQLTCEDCGATFPKVLSRPVLLGHDNEVFAIADYGRSIAPDSTASSRAATFIPSPSVNLASQRVLTRLAKIVSSKGGGTVLVVGGGTQRAWLDTRLGVGEHLRTLYTDIAATADVELYCDAHVLPFEDGCFAAIVTTAVLEHVLYPERVAAELRRVLKPGGLVYSELPFMQQVHGGAYDFTRFTHAGHRRLLNGFAEIESGMVAGPATALVWSIENLLLAFLRGPRSRRAGKAASRLAFGWIKHVDRLLLHRAEALDGASCTYFLGEKSSAPISDKAIIAAYRGAGLQPSSSQLRKVRASVMSG